MMVPQHCIDKFQEQYKRYPSFISFEIDEEETIKKFLSKSQELWVTSIVEDKKIKKIERLVEYDSTGIFIYVNLSDKITVTLLTTLDRYGVAEFSVNKLIKS